MGGGPENSNYKGGPGFALQVPEAKGPRMGNKGKLVRLECREGRNEQGQHIGVLLCKVRIGLFFFFFCLKAKRSNKRSLIKDVTGSD